MLTIKNYKNIETKYPAVHIYEYSSTYRIIVRRVAYTLYRFQKNNGKFEITDSNGNKTIELDIRDIRPERIMEVITSKLED